MSDIWSEFEKIAVSQGLISAEAADNNPRPNVHYDSVAEDDVHLFYDIKSEPEKQKSLIELAHPETFVVGRAYDAMNSVVENDEQRQAIMAYIALKQPNGHATQRRYVAAKKDLLDSLIRSAFTLDNKDEEGLMVLADSCAHRLSDRGMKKEAIGVAGVAGIVGGVAAVLGMGYYFFKGAPPAEDVYQNAQKVIKALEPLSDRSYAAPIRNDMGNLIAMAKQVYAVKKQLVPVHSVDEAINLTQQANEKKKAETAHQILTNYMQQLVKVKQAIKSWVSAIRVMGTEDTEERGEWSAKLHALTKNLFDNAETTLIYALEGKSDLFTMLPGQHSVRGGLLEAIDQELVKFQGAVDVAKDKAPEIQQTLVAEAPKTETAPAETLSAKPIAANTDKKSPTMADLNNELFQTMQLPVAADDDFLDYLKRI